MLKKLYKRIAGSKSHSLSPIETYLKGNRKPWSRGYEEYKAMMIEKSINDIGLLDDMSEGILPKGYGLRLDERIVEYAWIFSKLHNGQEKLLDAGSTFNFEFIVNHPCVQEKTVDICTYYPEENCFHRNGISYLFSDLRNLPYRDNLFDTVVSQSTIEHIDMDNSIYGYEVDNSSVSETKSYDYLNATSELIRIVKPQGKLLLTFPFGKFENHGFFQQFDLEMMEKILEQVENQGTYSLHFFKYEKDGWRFASANELDGVESYNPHTGRGKGDDGAAHCRSICCLEFRKN